MTAGERLRIGIVATASAAILVADIAWRDLWQQPRIDDGTLTGWSRMLLTMAFWLLWWIAFGLHGLVAGRRRAFTVRPGRFVSPARDALRSVATMGALALWGAVPVVTLRSGRPAVGAGVAVVALIATVLLARVWRRTVELTPDALVLRAVFDEPLVAPWDGASPSLVEGLRNSYAVRPEIIAAAIEHYRDHPEHRAAIGTEAELDRLAAAISAAGPAAAAR